MEERVIESAIYIIEHNATVRQTAKQFGVSKSTVHKDVTERLETINKTLARQARKVLDINKSDVTSGVGLQRKRNIFIDRTTGRLRNPGYTCKIVIEDTHPPVWRRVIIPDQINFLNYTRSI